MRNVHLEIPHEMVRAAIGSFRGEQLTATERSLVGAFEVRLEVALVREAVLDRPHTAADAVGEIEAVR